MKTISRFFSVSNSLKTICIYYPLTVHLKQQLLFLLQKLMFVSMKKTV